MISRGVMTREQMQLKDVYIKRLGSCLTLDPHSRTTTCLCVSQTTAIFMPQYCIMFHTPRKSGTFLNEIAGTTWVLVERVTFRQCQVQVHMTM